MDTQSKRAKGISRRGFMQIVAVGGAAAACWQLGLFGQDRQLQAARRSLPIMGTIMNLTVYGTDRDGCEEALGKTVSTMQGLEAKLSRHMASSELASLNSTGSLRDPGVDLLHVLDMAGDLNRKTAGAFDVTMLPLLLLHEENRGLNSALDSSRLVPAQQLVGFSGLVRDENGLHFSGTGMGISLDGIGKGYIVDQGVATLAGNGFHNVYVEAGGDLMVSGLKAADTPWRIGIRNPRPEQGQKMVTLAVSNKAVATSGDYLQAFTPDLRHHHIIDPRSGFSPPELASCTVTAPNVALADGLATALMVLGTNDALDLIESLDGCEAYLVGKDLRVSHSTGFSADMKTIRTKKGLDIPIAGGPEQTIRPGNPVRQVALLGDDYVAMKPTMLVQPGDRVITGQAVFTDKRNEGVIFTSPGCGTVVAVNRGEKRRFQSLVVELDGEEAVEFCPPGRDPEQMEPQEIRELLVKSGLWTALRTRPYGKTPAVEADPASLFITAIDTAPLAARPLTIINQRQEEYQLGLKTLRRLLAVPVHYCTGEATLQPCEQVEGLTYWSFEGPHPSGLASTHIHFIDPVHENKSVWQICYQDVIAIGHLLRSGTLLTERVVALAGAAVMKPALVRTRLGAALPDLCRRETFLEKSRVISGSVLSGREAKDPEAFLGRFHNQVSVIADSNGRSLFNWLMPGTNRFSIKPVFASAFRGKTVFPMNTALWGGKRAIYPLGTYDQVMPLDIIATSLLKSIAKGDTEKSKALGCLELIEEDLGLCGFVCPGKNEFGPSLREVLTAIELGG
jgi:Na+-transporting NADH:ubiquinone oxidoreductase subunit A